MKLHRTILTCIGLASLLLVSACGDSSVTETLGLSRTAPDEFTVVSRPSLAVPPEFTLRPPHPGEAPRAPTADATAHGLMIGQEAKPVDSIDSMVEPTVPTAVMPVITTNQPTGADATFLKRAGADAASSDIRDKLGADAAAPADTSKAKSLLEQVSGQSKDELVVDAKKEAERLRANKDEGKPANEGDVPVEPTKPPSVLDRVF